MNEFASMWLIYKYLQEPTKSKLKRLITCKGSRASGSPEIHCQVVNKRIRSYDPEDIVSTAEIEVTLCAQGNPMTEGKLEKTSGNGPKDFSPCYPKLI